MPKGIHVRALSISENEMRPSVKESIGEIPDSLTLIGLLPSSKDFPYCPDVLFRTTVRNLREAAYTSAEVMARGTRLFPTGEGTRLRNAYIEGAAIRMQESNCAALAARRRLFGHVAPSLVEWFGDLY
jgi:hypothetical protein